MNLLLLAPDIQEAILFLPKTTSGHDPIKLKHLQPICLEMDWGRQREKWGGIASYTSRPTRIRHCVGGVASRISAPNSSLITRMEYLAAAAFSGVLTEA